jgi:hypothetical protein
MPHTPGPWFYDFDTVYCQPGGPDGESDDTEIICEVETGLAGDLHLIAAAPDLLETLKSVMADAQSIDADLWEQAWNAIAKAEGRQP